MLMLGLSVAVAVAHAPPVLSREESARHYFLGVAHGAKGDPLRAAWEFTWAVHFDPTNADAWLARGLVFHACDLGQQAVSDFTRVIRLRPTADVYERRARLSVSRGDTQAAVADLTRALELAPESVSLRRLRGGVHAQRGESELAVRDLTAALAVTPSDENALMWRGVSHFQAGHTDLALADMAAALRLAPDNQAAVYNRGVMYAHLGQDLKADIDFARAIELKPDDQAAYARRGELHAKAGDPATARRCFTRVIALDPKNVAAYRQRATLNTTGGEFAAALADLETVAELERSPAAYKELARFRLDCPDARLRDAKKAVELAETAAVLARLAVTAGNARPDPSYDQLRASALAAAGDHERAVYVLGGVLANHKLTAADLARVDDQIGLYQRMVALRRPAPEPRVVAVSPTLLPLPPLVGTTFEKMPPPPVDLPPIIIPELPPVPEPDKR